MCIRDRNATDSVSDLKVNIDANGSLLGQGGASGSAGITVTPPNVSVAVSYTHLDVYKRQLFGKRGVPLFRRYHGRGGRDAGGVR